MTRSQVNLGDVMFGLIMMLFVSGCIDDENRGNLEDSSILGIGDSIMEWNLGEGSVPEQVGDILDVSVYNAAISGSMMSTAEDWSIPNQFIERQWDWVILDGGANDLNELCGCGSCETVHTNLVVAYQDLIQKIRAGGSRIVIWGYYGIPSEAPEFGNCNESIDQLSKMQFDLAEQDDGVIWVNGKTEITGDDLVYYDDDLIHPSYEGGAKIAEQIANAIENVQ